MRASVLVTCYRRRQYLPRSVESARRDGADQVVVVKDWADPVLDATLRSDGVVVITEDIPGIGAALARGLSACDGEVVSFLDDDDLIVPGRLAAVRSGFESDPRVALVRNGYAEIDASDRPYRPPGGRRSQPTAPERFAVSAMDRERLRWIVRYRAYGILSTLSIRREMLGPYLEELSSVECGIDVAVPTLLMRDGFVHAFVPDPLSVHRVGSSLRGGTTSDDPAAFARTFRRLERTATTWGGREYAAMNARWANLERLIGRRRLAGLQTLRAGTGRVSLRSIARILLPAPDRAP